MKIWGLCQAYNEETFIARSLSWSIPVLDHLIITEGRLTPFGNLPEYSSDQTRKIIQDFQQTTNKITLLNPSCENGVTREWCEGSNKNNMLRKAIEMGLEPEDIICIIDCDEFWEINRFNDTIDFMRKYEDVTNVAIEEYQFAYNLRLFFNASHSGRFIRYVKGARFGSTNHFIYPNGEDVTKDYRYLRTREKTGMIHLCWTKEPRLIREKVLSFNRPSFTAWYNYVYLAWPFDPEAAYYNNSQILPWRGLGFCEGQNEKIQEFRGKLPAVLDGFNPDYLPYIQQHAQELRI